MCAVDVYCKSVCVHAWAVFVSLYITSFNTLIQLHILASNVVMLLLVISSCKKDNIMIDYFLKFIMYNNNKLFIFNWKI